MKNRFGQWVLPVLVFTALRAGAVERLCSVYLESPAALQQQVQLAAQVFESQELGMMPMMITMMLPGGNQVSMSDPVALHVFDIGSGRTASLVELTPATTAEMFLKSLTAAGTMVRDFSPLENLPLADLDIAGCRVDSLSWVAGLPLRSLNLAQTGASDLSPLRGKELNYLNISDTKVRDLEELKFVSVRHLSLRGMKLDLTPLIGTKLERLDLDDPELFLSVLRRIQGLERINGMTIPELIDAFRGR